MKNYHILKTHCKGIFLLGNGNFWYEENEIGDDQRLLYRIYSFIFILLYCVMTVMEIMAVAMVDMSKDQTRDSISCTFTHIIILIKIYLILANKSLIKDLSRKMVQVCQNYEEEQLMADKYKFMKINVVTYFLTVYGSYAFYISEGLRNSYKSGTQFYMIVTYYPTLDDDSTLAAFVRIFFTTLIFIMLLTMIVTVESFTLVYIVMYKYKFIVLRRFFERLEDDVKSHELKQDLATERLTAGLIEGIEMHINVLMLSKDIDKVFGTVLAVQLCQSSATAVSILLQIALSDDLTFTAAAKLIFFAVALFFLLGLFLCNAGEITYEASLVSDAIFYSGWQICDTRTKNIPQQNNRQLILLAVMQAQQPLIMKAFKMFELSYETFLMVVRGTYSVFTLFYSQNKK